MEQANAKALHLDVMDGVFVPNMTYGIPVVEAFNKSTKLPLDVHLMIQSPEKYLQAYAEAGADILTIHVESTDDPQGCVDQIHQLGVAAGIAVNPDTPLSAITDLAPQCELVLIMSVHAGFGGQSFIQDALLRLRTMRELSSKYLLEVDGGINAETISSCAEAGADLFVVGSAIFDESNYDSAISNLEKLSRVP